MTTSSMKVAVGGLDQLKASKSMSVEQRRMFRGGASDSSRIRRPTHGFSRTSRGMSPAAGGHTQHSSSTSGSVLESWVTKRRPELHQEHSDSTNTAATSSPALGVNARQSHNNLYSQVSARQNRSTAKLNLANKAARGEIYLEESKEEEHADYMIPSSTHHSQSPSVENAMQFATSGIEIVKNNPGRAATVLCGGIVGGVAGFAIAGPAGAIIGAKVGQITSGTGILIDSGVAGESITNSVNTAVGKTRIAADTDFGSLESRMPVRRTSLVKKKAIHN